MLEWRADNQRVYLAASCRYRGLEHIRHFLWMVEDQALMIVDLIAGPLECHTVEQW